MRLFRFKNAGFLLLVITLLNCSRKSEDQFYIVPPEKSGIEFSNTITESVEFNIFNYMYFYNGGGVATGDLNGDNLPDIYFTGNQVPNKLYLNKGNLTFKDVTDISGVAGFKGWATGVTMADVNNDGRLDIYVGYLGDYEIYKSKNQLFINEGNNAEGVPVFSDKAYEYGLDLIGFSTQAAFLDYDRDGDLDMFMLNHSLHQNGTFGRSSLRKTPHPLAGDKLLQNDNGHFTDVTEKSGIFSSVIGYGLGVVVSDINLDGWPDIYVGNDFHENDYLYINQRDGTFKEQIEQQMNHTSRYTMGVDFADVNNDIFPDLVSMDMLPSDPLVLKSSMAEEPYDVYNFKINYGYNHQFARNTLQINNHNGTFSEVGLLAGTSATDWSWSALFADFNLDGHKDIFVSNGILRRSNDLDYINFITVDTIQRGLQKVGERELSYLNKMPKIKLANFLFLNNRDSTFKNVALTSGLEKKSYSNGAAYADFDNDGDLDLVVNNIEDPAFLIENRIRNRGTDKPSPNYLQILLKGKSGNQFGLGAKVLVYIGKSVQIQECMATRGYQSAVDTRLSFGLAEETVVDSLLVIWNDGSFERIDKLEANKIYTLDQSRAKGDFDYSTFHKTSSWVAPVEQIGLDFKHKENHFIEFNRESLMPHMVSTEGPAVAKGDVNNDGLEDLFLGGGKWQPGEIYVQAIGGRFMKTSQPVLVADSTYEDVEAVFFDANGDGVDDLVVVSGGNEWTGKSNYRKPRLYINDGMGNFSKSKGMPDIFLTGSTVSVVDIDGDKDIDIFIGARAVPWKYGVKPNSYLLSNDGNGNFTDITDDAAPDLKGLGLIKDSRWADLDGNGQPDLIIAAEWSPITILLNKDGKFALVDSEQSGLQTTSGLWNSVEVADLDNDGDVDMVFGNLGLNSKLKCSPEEPVRLYVGDLDNNDSIDQVLTHFVNGKEYPFYTRDELTKQLPYLKKKFLAYKTYASATLEEVFDAKVLKRSQMLVAHRFESSIVENLGNGKFAIRALPKAAQFSTVNALLIADLNHDQVLDIVCAGNFYPINIQLGRYDASYGLILKGKGKGNFESISAHLSGLSMEGQTRHLIKVDAQSISYLLAIRNNKDLKSFVIK